MTVRPLAEARGYQPLFFERPEALAELESLWRRLSDSDARATLFNTWEWNVCWFRHYWRPDYRLRIILLQREGRPAALLPLYFNPAHRAWLFLGSGEPEMAEVSSEYLDFIVASEEEGEPLLEAMAACLQEWPGPLELRNCVAGSRADQVLARLKRVRRLLTGRAYRVHLAGGYDAVAAGFSAKERKKGRQSLTRFRAGPSLSFAFEENAGREELWNALERLHQADWQARGKPGAFAEAVFSAFHRDMHESFPALAQCFAVLRQGEDILAIHHYYRYRDSLYFYLTATDRDRESRLSPGVTLHLLMFEKLGDSGLEYDFLKGAVEDSYKGRFCSANEGFYTFLWGGPGLRGWLRDLLWRGDQTARVLLRRARALRRKPSTADSAANPNL